MTGAAVDDDLMRLDEHRGLPDGSRPLQIDRPLPSLSAQFLEGPERTCWSARHLPNPPVTCRLRITAGEHYVLWTELDLDGKATGRVERYCAACAVREWEHVQVREITA